MGFMEKPNVTTEADGAKYWEHTYDTFSLKVYVPVSTVDGQTNNYSFRAPLLLVFEEKRQTMQEAIAFAKQSGLDRIAAAVDSSVLFVYPTKEGGWAKADEALYQEVIANVKMDQNYEDGMVKIVNFFTGEFQGYYARGAIFRADIYSFGASADYVATHLLKSIQGEYLWGPGEITPAMCSMERLSVTPVVERTDIGILSVANQDTVNKAFADCKHLLIKERADYEADFKTFVRRFKMWCGNMEMEPDFDALHMTEDAGYVMVNTSEDNYGKYKGSKEHKVGYFAYYNEDTFQKGPAPLVIGFHGGGDSSMYLTFVSGWYEIAHQYGFLYVALENHQDVTPTEVIEVLEGLKERYAIDSHRIYATGFSMGSGKTWGMYQEYPEVFAGLAPASALFPVTSDPFGRPVKTDINRTVSVPMFYSGGENSHLPELPFQADTSIERIQYLAEVNCLKDKFDIQFSEKEKWEDPIWGERGERVEVIHDASRDSDLKIHYFDSTDGVCRTALASVSGQGHEYRRHTGEQAWKFISQFTR